MDRLSKTSYRDYSPQFMNAAKNSARAGGELSVKASTDQSVSAESAHRVGGSSASRSGDLSSYLHLLSGREVPSMAEHFGGERTDEAESNLPPLLGEESDDAVDGESVEVGEGQRSAESEKGEKTEGSDPSKKKSVSGEELSKEESAEV